MDNDDVDNLAAAASQFLGLQAEIGESVRGRSKEKFGALVNSHMLVVGAIGSAVTRRDGARTKIVTDSQRQVVLIAAFIQGINIVERSISEGYYIQAAALVRQELETIAALEEIKKGRRVDRKTPNVAHVPWSLGEIYGELSKAAHASDHEVLQGVLAASPSSLAKDTAWVVMIQKFNEDISWKLYALHVTLLILLATHLNEYHETVHGEGQGLSEAEIQAVRKAQDIMIEGGWLIVQP